MTIHTLTTLLASRLFIGYEGFNPAAFTQGDKYIVYSLSNETKGKHPVASYLTEEEADKSVARCNQYARELGSDSVYYHEFLGLDSVP